MEKKDSTQLLLIIFVILTFALGGFVFYDKVLKKETKTIETGNNDNSSTNCPKCQECEKCDNTLSQCNCPNSSSNGISINSLKGIKITNVNQTFKVGNKELKLRIGKYDNKMDVLFINDKVAWTSKLCDNLVYVLEEENNAYVTDKYILFTQFGQCDTSIHYAIDENGKEIVVNDNGYQFNNLKINNGLLSAKGAVCLSEEPDEDLVIKYIDHTLIVTKAN